jgi:hypothetical protein
MTSKVEVIGNDPKMWQQRAEELLDAADVLRQNRKGLPGRLWSELLLRGCALENLLKCLYVSRGRALYVNDKLSAMKDHDLAKMAQEAGYPCTKQDSLLMSKLTRVVRWAGRYPVQAKGSDPESVEWFPSDDGDLDQLVDSVVTKIRSLPPHP